MKAEGLIVTVNFPSHHDNKDGMGNYVSRVAHALCKETGMKIHIVAFRCGDQEPFESMNGLQIRRLKLPARITHYNDIYLPQNFKTAVTALAQGAVRAVDEIGYNIPVWCHGYESGSTVKALRSRGCPVVGVLHYLIVQDLLHRLEIAKDPLRKTHFPLSISSVLGSIIPKKYHKVLIRALIKSSRYVCMVNIPNRISVLRSIDQESMLIRDANRIISVSPAFKDTITEFYPNARCKISHCLAGHPMIDSEPYWPLQGNGNSLRIIMVGRPFPQKGWDYAAEALKSLDTDYPDEAKRIQLVLVGGLGDWEDGYNRNINQILLSLQNISYSNVGEIPNHEVHKLMAGADVLLMPSIFEPFGLVMLEAMSAGCMVIASDCDGPRQVLKQPWGILMPFKNPAKRTSNLLSGLHRILSLSRAELKKHGESARKEAQNYSWGECAKVHARELLCAKANNA